jgi:hypothetical protein
LDRLFSIQNPVPDHQFPYDHDNSLESNLQSVHSELSQMEQYQEEEVEYSGGMHR